MKFKQRALALILSAAMMLTFMPALAFADDEPAADDQQPVAEEVQDEAVPAEEPVELTAADEAQPVLAAELEQTELNYRNVTVEVEDLDAIWAQGPRTP